MRICMIIVLCMIITTQKKFKITARLYDLNVTNETGKITEDNIFKGTEDGIYIKDLEEN